MPELKTIAINNTNTLNISFCNLSKKIDIIQIIVIYKTQCW